MAAWTSRSWSDGTGEAFARLDRGCLISAQALREAQGLVCVAPNGYSNREDRARENRFLSISPGGDRLRLRPRCRTAAGSAGVRPAAPGERAGVEVTTGQPVARHAAARLDDPLSHRVRRLFCPGEPRVSSVVEPGAFIPLPR